MTTKSKDLNPIAVPCKCGNFMCPDWHVTGVADLQGVGFTQYQAKLIAHVLRDTAVVRHLKRGSKYSIVARGDLQCSTTLREGDMMVAYLSHDHDHVFFRPAAEFDDGRFEQLDE